MEGLSLHLTSSYTILLEDLCGKSEGEDVDRFQMKVANKLMRSLKKCENLLEVTMEENEVHVVMEETGVILKHPC